MTPATTEQATSLHWQKEAGAPETAAQARLELAAICRLVAREKMAPVGGARFAIRNPERNGTAFVNPGGRLLDEVTATSLVEVDRDGQPANGGTAAPDAGGLALVLALLDAKSDATAAAWVASRAGSVVASLKDGLLPMTQTSFMYRGRVAVHDWDPSADAEALRAQVARDLGDDRALLVRGRGLAVAAETAAQTWKLLFFLDKCCRSQVQAMAAANAAGRPLKLPSQPVIDHAVGQSLSFVAHPRFTADWPSFLDQLDREDPSWRG